MPSDTTDHRRPTTVKNHHHHHGLPPQEPEHLPCPRCDSTNTKFCYYNNYNFSQPRHFCKACRRYWTQGGTLRDIPVGGGSRKNAKRQRVCHTSTSRDILPTVTTNPVLMSFSGAHTGAPLNGGFTSLLSSNAHSPGFFGAGVCGFDQDVGFGLGRMGWPFSGMGGGVGGGGSAAVSGGDGNTWQLESGDGYVLSDLAISTPGSGMKIE